VWFKFMLPRNVRATEILMKQLSTATYKYLARAASLKIVSIGMSQEIARPDEREVLSPQIQRGIRRMRTDLDRFTPLEIDCLLRHGYAVARHQLTCEGWLGEAAATSSWSPAGYPIEHSSHSAKGIWKSQSRMMLRLFSPHDWTTWALAMLVLGVVALLYRLVF